MAAFSLKRLNAEPPVAQIGEKWDAISRNL